MKTILIVFLLIFIVSGKKLGPKEGNGNIPHISISALVNHHKDGLLFKTEAYVVFKYKCSSCPTGSQCKPCMGNNIVISENSGDFQSYNDLSSRHMILFLSDSASFIVKKKYRFFIKYESVDFDQSKKTIWKGRLINFEEI